MNICGRNEAENDSGDDRMLWSAGLHPTVPACALRERDRVLQAEIRSARL